MSTYKRFVLALSVVVLIGLVAAYFLEAQARTAPERWEDAEYGVVCYMVPGAISCLPIESALE